MMVGRGQVEKRDADGAQCALVVARFRAQVDHCAQRMLVGERRRRRRRTPPDRQRGRRPIEAGAHAAAATPPRGA